MGKKEYSYECHCGWQSMTKPPKHECPDCGNMVWDSPMRGMKEEIEALAEKSAAKVVDTILNQYYQAGFEFPFWLSDTTDFANDCAKDSFIAGYNAANEKHIEVYKWLLGYYDFPSAPVDGRPKYWFRTHLREKLTEMGIEVSNPIDGFPVKSDLDTPINNGIYPPTCAMPKDCAKSGKCVYKMCCCTKET